MTLKRIFLSPIFLSSFCVFSHAADTSFFDSKVLPSAEREEALAFLGSVEPLITTETFDAPRECGRCIA